jgi:hypothetical protein
MMYRMEYWGGGPVCVKQAIMYLSIQAQIFLSQLFMYANNVNLETCINILVVKCSFILYPVPPHWQ